MRTILMVAVFLVQPVLSAVGSAQAPHESGGGPRHLTLQTLADSQWVRLAVSGLGRRDGRVLERDDGVLVLSPGPQPIRVPATSIDTLWTRGTSAKTGVIAGGVIGVLLGAGLGALAAEMSDEHDFNTAEAMVAGAGVFGLGGGLLGVMIGSAIPRWKRQYP
jgi:hypothetical protein